MSPDAESPRPRSVAVVGLGLVGGSLARALKARPEPPRIAASSLDRAALARARDEGVVDEACADAGEAASRGDLVVYATPPLVTLDLVAEHLGAWRDGAVITDVVSVKAPLLERMRELGAADRYVGGHPMAGREVRGFAGARDDLFLDARVHLVRGDAEDTAADLVEAVWRRVGARPRWIDAREHDRRMAWTSHLPQLLSTVLAGLLAESGREPDELGPGGRDMTRLAQSPSDLWGELLGALRDEDVRALRATIRELENLTELLERDALDQLRERIERTGAWREGRGWS